jgi:hypothetical protein
MLYKDFGYTGIRITSISQAEILDGVVTGTPQLNTIFDDLALLENFSRIEESTASETGVNRNQKMKVSILETDYPDFTFDLSIPLESIEVEFNLSKKSQNTAFDISLGSVVKCKVTDVYKTGHDILQSVIFEIVTLE